MGPRKSYILYDGQTSNAVSKKKNPPSGTLWGTGLL